MTKSRFPRTAFGAIVLTCLLGGCAAPPAPDRSLYERLGGKAAITAVVDDAIGNIAADPRIQQRFRSIDPVRLKGNLIDLLCQRSGGPCVYTGRNMADAHERMHIGDDEFDALIEDIAKSFDKFKVPVAERREALGLLDQMRNAIVGH